MSWTKGTRVKFKGRIIQNFLDDLAPRARRLGISLHVTSGYRSPYDQARVVCNNVASSGGKNLSIYGSKTRDMYRQHCPNLAPLEAYEKEKLARNIAKNPNYSGHGTGKAVDLRVRNLSHSQKLQLQSLLRQMGVKVLWEKHPEHFHVWVKKWRGSSGSTAWGWWIAGGIFTAATVSAIIVGVNRRRR